MSWSRRRLVTINPGSVCAGTGSEELSVRINVNILHGAQNADLTVPQCVTQWDLQGDVILSLEYRANVM